GLPVGLARATVEAALRFATGGKDGIAARVLVLAEGGMTAVRMTGMKIVALLLGMSLIVSAGGVLARQIGAREETGPHPRLEESGAGVKTPGRKEPEDKAAARVDRFGDPLPPGALARLGTMRLRHNGPGASPIFGPGPSLSFTPDGKSLLTSDGKNPPRLWD